MPLNIPWVIQSANLWWSWAYRMFRILPKNRSADAMLLTIVVSSMKYISFWATFFTGKICSVSIIKKKLSHRWWLILINAMSIKISLSNHICVYFSWVVLRFSRFSILWQRCSKLSLLIELHSFLSELTWASKYFNAAVKINEHFLDQTRISKKYIPDWIHDSRRQRSATSWHDATRRCRITRDIICNALWFRLNSGWLIP